VIQSAGPHTDDDFIIRRFRIRQISQVELARNSMADQLNGFHGSIEHALPQGDKGVMCRQPLWRTLSLTVPAAIRPQGLVPETAASMVGTLSRHDL
jgi:hypothetical protein